MGHITFNLHYASSHTYDRSMTASKSLSTRIPIHGDAYFMPDWTREKGWENYKRTEKKVARISTHFWNGKYF